MIRMSRDIPLLSLYTFMAWAENFPCFITFGEEYKSWELLVM